MAAITQPSPLLALPLELRIFIYNQLLNPDPDSILTLYHDRHGRQASSDIDTTILRVNKQIYSEAVSILYDTANVRIDLSTRVIRQCKGGNYLDDIDDPPNLFRTDYEEAFKSANKADWRTAPSTVEGLECHPRLESVTSGYIYPHCFQRLSKIHLLTSRLAIWGCCRGGSYLSHTGQTVLRILKLLAEEQVTKSPLPKRVRITIQPDLHTVEARMMMRNGEAHEKTIAMIGLLKALQRRIHADIDVKEAMFTKVFQEVKMDDAEIDEWEKVLLADIHTDL